MSNDNVRPMDQPKNPNQLERVLLAMLNPQNNIRRAAEKCLETFFENAACVPAMMQQIMSGPDARARQMAAVLLRKRLSVGLWRSSEKHWNATTNGLMRRLVEESVWPVRKAVAALACRVAKLTIPDGKWPQLLGFLVQLSTKPKEELRTVSMLLFRAMGENLGQHMVKHLEKYAKVCVQGLRDPAVRVRVEAFRAMEGVVGYLETKEHVEMYGNLIPLAVKSAQEILKKDADDAAPALELFNTLAESPVPVLEKYLIPLTKFMMEVSVKCENMSLSDTAMRFVQSVVDMKPHRLVRANMIPDVLRAAFYFVSKPDDNPFDPDEVTAQRIGVCMISALVESVPYKHVLNPCLQTSVKLIKSDNPHHKRGGMAIIAAIAEGFSLLLREALPDLLDATLSLIQNKSAMVRVAACVCLLQLCDHIQPDICNYHERLVKAMVTTLDRPGEHPMVRVKMATAMCAFLEGLDPETMAIYIKPLMKKFGQLVTGNESEDMKEMAIGGIMSVAIASEEKFTPFFKDSANALFHFMSKKADEDLKLRARATECMGCVAVAVGKDIFRPCLNQVFALADENLTLDYFSLSEATFRLYTSLAQCLGEEFCKVLPKVHQYAVKCLESMDGVEIRHQGGDMSAFHQEDVHDEDDMLRQMQYSIRSGAVDEKAAAIQSMQSFAEFCGRGYLPFIKPTLDICKEMLEYPHEFVRHGVAAVLHEMIKLAHKTFPNPQNSNKMQKSAMAIVMATLPHILEMINVETDKQCCAEAVDAVKTSIESFGVSILETAGKPLLENLETMMKEKAPCQTYHDEEQDAKDETDHDEVLIDHVTDLLSTIAKATGPRFEPLFVRFIPHLLKFNAPNRSAPDRLMAVGTIGDIADHMKGSIKKYLPKLFPIIIKALADSEPEVRRNAAYTVGILVVHGGETAAPFYKASIESLKKLQHIPAESKDNEFFHACADNATSAIGKIMQQKKEILTQPQVISWFMGGLPLKNDQEEAKTVYSVMATLLRQHTAIMKDHMAHALFVCGRVFATEGVRDNIKQGLIPVAKSLSGALGSNAGAAVQGLSAEEKDRLLKVLKSK